MSLKLDLSTPRAARHSATARAASEVEAEILTPTEFLDQLAGSPRAARELIQRLSQRLCEADDRIVNYERRNGRALGTRKDAESQTAVEPVINALYEEGMHRDGGAFVEGLPRVHYS
jgi:CRP-like cAMP-binding protein